MSRFFGYIYIPLIVQVFIVKMAKKTFALRVDDEMFDAIEKWADDEFRSVNGQIEWILSEALKKSKRYPKKVSRKNGSDKSGCLMMVPLLLLAAFV